MLAKLHGGDRVFRGPAQSGLWAAAPSPPRFRFGASSWPEESWVDSFYPAGTKPAEFLSYYATQFDAGFTLCAKFPHSIVSPRQAGGVGRRVGGSSTRVRAGAPDLTLDCDHLSPRPSPE